MTKGYLILETGEVFAGDWIGAKKEIAGEVVFNTSMTGYQEMMTDPSYAGQILTFCYPLIGNYGISADNGESDQPAVSAVISSEACDEPSHYESAASFSEELKQAGIPGLTQVDTRALVAAIRKHRTVRGKLVFSNNDQSGGWGEQPAGALVKGVSVTEPKVFGEGDEHIVLMDFGYKKSILDYLVKQGCTVTVVPYHTTLEEIGHLDPDGVVLSNGPGDPMELEEIFPVIKGLTETYPTLGICLGHQLIALAYGAETEKMPFGHRGGNHPVKDLFTKKVCMTSQNHGYVVKENSLDHAVFEVQFRNVNDQSLEGMRHVHLPVQSVQFHPEAHPGPSDTEYIFTEFIQQVANAKGGAAYAEAK